MYESLTEIQNALQATVEKLTKALQPFNEVEKVAGVLGIPVDARGKPTESINSNSLQMDPRSPEFLEILNKLSSAIHFLRGHPDCKDSDNYLLWLEQLQHRATSIIARNMKDLIDKAKQSSISKLVKSTSTSTSLSSSAQSSNPATYGTIDEKPLESSPIYSKFRNICFRMRDLASLLIFEIDPMSSNSPTNTTQVLQLDSDGAPLVPAGTAALSDVKHAYVLIRCELLKVALVDGRQFHPSTSPRHGSDHPSGESAGIGTDEGGGQVYLQPGLCTNIRLSFSTLLRLTQLEYQLYEAMFSVTDRQRIASTSEVQAPYTDSTIESPAAPALIPDLLVTGSESCDLSLDSLHDIIDYLSGMTGDFLRPLVIHTTDVEELCRVAATLADDIRSQILSLKVPRPLLRGLMQALERTVSDAQERLAYCAETTLRLDVQMFEPLPTQVAYPDILEKHQASSRASPPSSPSVSGSLESVAGTWYPPLRSTLSLLSRLYGVVDRAVFDDIARRSVVLCVEALRRGSEAVRRVRLQLHSDLFLVRHLLILREQLVPFDLHLQFVEKHLDFRPTGHALAQLMSRSYSMLRLDGGNAFYQMALDGVPDLAETQVDAKKDLETALRSACGSLRLSALRTLLGPLDGFLAKVTAFLGEIPIAEEDGGSGGYSRLDGGGGVGESKGGGAMATLAVSSGLKSQAFMRPERIKDMLENVVQLVAEGAPDLRSTLQVRVIVLLLLFRECITV